MLKAMRCDLHIHTCLSPCAELDMHPRAIVRRALEKKLDIIGICDHNASENVGYVQRAASGLPLAVLPGMEVSSREEVHTLALFENIDGLRNFQELVYAHLEGENDEEVFGCQVIVNENDEVEGFNSRLLIGATSLPLQEVIAGIHGEGGIAIASHVDRESFSVLGQLGFIDPSFAFDALEFTPRMCLERARLCHPELARYPFVSSSDAHFIGDIGRGWTEMMLAEASFREIRLALAGAKGRRIVG
ncbi:MAG: PHP-associated domain-containing protein [Pseudomonadota bacterium]|nr:PHP-associated domain-containing protein [Pseudomonadota bacterium]